MSKLWSPMRVGPVTLGHRVVMAPLTRYRSDEEWVPLPMAKGTISKQLSSDTVVG
jgi:NADPH2 dehydrogenase